MIPVWNDGHLHALASTNVERGVRVVVARCGLDLRQDAKEPLWGASGFDSRVTCPECKETP